MTVVEKPDVIAAVQAILQTSTSILPDVFWLHDDDLCDCTFQRIGQWTNRYLAETLEVRLCCLWAEIYKQYPQFVRTVPASYDVSLHRWEPDPQPWDSEDSDMPLPIWYRQLARQTGRPLAEIRQEYADKKHLRPQKLGRTRSHKELMARSPASLDVAAARLERLRLTGWL